MGRGAGSGAEKARTDTWPVKADGMRQDFIYSEEKEPHIVR
jgi:hypothetical protein